MVIYTVQYCNLDSAVNDNAHSTIHGNINNSLKLKKLSQE